MTSIIGTSLQKANTLVRKAIGKKTLIFIGVINVALVTHKIIRPEIKARRRKTQSADADYIYEMERKNLSLK